MVIDIIILALLSKSPRHGYEIKKDLSLIFYGRKKLNNNLLYPALLRLEKEGSIKKEIVRQTGKPDKNVYTITPTGKNMFSKQINIFDKEEASRNDEFLVRLAFFDMIDPSIQKKVLDMRLDELKLKSVKLKTMTDGFKGEFDSHWVSSILSFHERNLSEEIGWVESLRDGLNGKTRKEIHER
jgi:DNA-binding PadR family transcriptional regulator